jgi:predicted MFS family arabinose efflux permease
MSDLPAPAPELPPVRLSPTRIITTVWLAVFATSLFFRAVDPIIPKIAADLNEPFSKVALLATAFALPYALMQPFLGAAADVLGKTRMMFACLVLVTISTFAGAFAPNLEILMVTRIISGIVAGGTFPIALALVADVVPVEKRQVAIGRILAGGMLGNLLGASTSGIVGDFIDWRGVFVLNGFCALAAVIAAFIGFGGPGRKPPRTVDLRAIPATYRALFANPFAKFCFGGVLLEGIFLMGSFPFIAPFLHDAGEPRATIAGLVIGSFGIGGMLYSFVIPWLLPRLKQRRLMFLGGTLMGLGLMALSLAPPWQTQVLIFIMFGLAFYFLHGTIQIMVTELVPSARGSAAAMHSTFFFLGQSIGPIYYGFAFAQTGGHVLPLVTGGFVLIATGIVCGIYLGQRPR